MKVTPTAIPDVIIIEPAVFEDDRGWFMESFNQQKFHEALQQLGLPIPRPFVQDNRSCSKKGVLRGFHYQLPPYAQGKLVRVVKGAAFDVAVDIRSTSATFAKHVAVELSAENHRMLWIPEGFAHGFVALEDDTHFLYKATDFYNQKNEQSIRWDDPVISICWPLADSLIISAKDISAKLLTAPDRIP